MLLLVISLFTSSIQENNPSTPQPDEEEAEESGKELVDPESYIKHPLQNRLAPKAIKQTQKNKQINSKFLFDWNELDYSHRQIATVLLNVVTCQNSNQGNSF